MVYQTGLTMTEIDLIYKPFISEPKSMVIAPAGYGKTHCIVESLNISEQLIGWENKNLRIREIFKHNLQ